MALKVERICLPDGDGTMARMYDVSEDWLIGRLRDGVTDAPSVLFVRVACASGGCGGPGDEPNQTDGIIGDAVERGSAA